MSEKPVQLEIGSVFKKQTKGNYYFRYQINGQRKCISLKTSIKKDAVVKAKDMIPILKATTTEVISAHVKHARDLIGKHKKLRLVDAWDIYSKHPEKSTPSTVAEVLGYQASYKEFVNYIDDNDKMIHEITEGIAWEYSEHLRSLNISVDTHNRKIGRIRKIFEVLEGYRDGKNPFAVKSVRRKTREEQANKVRRLSFTHEQEQHLLQVLEDDKYKVMYKPEIRVIYHIGMFTGQRFKDCVLLKWSNVDINKKRIWVMQFKTGKEVSIPIAPKLLTVLKDAQEWKTDQYVCPNVAIRYNKVDKNGKNVGNNLVNIDALRVIKWIGLEPSVEVPGRKKKVTVYGFHSLRHSFVSHCAETGLPKAVVLSIIGANSEIIDKHYTHIGDEAQEKAIAAISDHFEDSTEDKITDGDKIRKALTYIERLPSKNCQIQDIEKILKG
ncbi:MAG: site-specific integrase [Victivallales bacterium]|nr:site-specific integrase [Victivallales bacterium]